MIWVAGRIVPDESLSIGVGDRTFEHGLGLFETLRTWGGRAPLLDRHLARVTRSAAALGLPLDPANLPDAAAVSSLLAANGAAGDTLLRITLTGGTSAPGSSVVWMRSGPLPPPASEGGAIVAGTWDVAREDLLARHKGLNYWSRRLAHERAIAAGADETLSRTPDGRIWEGSRTSLFLVVAGSLITPPASGPIVPGVMRALVLERVREATEAEAGIEALARADEAFLTNSVRGIVPVGRLFGRSLPAPGPWTLRVSGAITAWLGDPRG